MTQKAKAIAVARNVSTALATQANAKVSPPLKKSEIIDLMVEREIQKRTETLLGIKARAEKAYARRDAEAKKAITKIMSEREITPGNMSVYWSDQGFSNNKRLTWSLPSIELSEEVVRRQHKALARALDAVNAIEKEAAQNGIDRIATFNPQFRGYACLNRTEIRKEIQSGVSKVAYDNLATLLNRPEIAKLVDESLDAIKGK